MLGHWESVDSTGRTQNFKIESPSLFGRGANHYKLTFFSFFKRCGSLIFHKFYFHIITYYFHQSSNGVFSLIPSISISHSWEILFSLPLIIHLGVTFTLLLLPPILWKGVLLYFTAFTFILHNFAFSPGVSSLTLLHLREMDAGQYR